MVRRWARVVGEKLILDGMEEGGGGRGDEDDCWARGL